MEPMISQAYEAILRLEDLLGIKLLNRKSLIQDAHTDDSHIEFDLAQFNLQVSELREALDSISASELKERLIHIRITAMNIENEFSRLASEIQQAFMDTAARDG